MSNALELYLKARQFFQENPKNWKKGSMGNPGGCMCYAGAMAYCENPNITLREFLIRGWDMNSMVREQVNPRIGVTTTNDKADSLEEATAEFDAIFGVTA